MSETVTYTDFDFGLLLLNQQVLLTTSVKLICLPLGNETYEGKKLLTSGWGRSDAGSEFLSPRLMTDTNTGNQVTDCVKDLKDQKVDLKPETIMCAGKNEAGEKFFGDSGG